MKRAIDEGDGPQKRVGRLHVGAWEGAHGPQRQKREPREQRKGPREKEDEPKGREKSGAPEEEQRPQEREEGPKRAYPRKRNGEQEVLNW